MTYDIHLKDVGGTNMKRDEAEKVEIVIKIPKYYLTHPQDYSCLVECVRRGVKLPKGHGDLVDRKDLIENGISKGFCDWYDEIKMAETIIEADKEYEEE